MFVYKLKEERRRRWRLKFLSIHHHQLPSLKRGGGGETTVALLSYHFFFNLFLASHCFEALSYFEILWFIFSYIPIEKREPRNNNMGDLNGSITDLRATFLKVFNVLKSELLNDPAFEWTANSYAWVDRVCFPFPFLFLYFFIFYLLSHSFPPYNVLFFFFFLLRINFYFYSLMIKREYWLKNWYLPHNHSFTFLHLLSAFNSIL